MSALRPAPGITLGPANAEDVPCIAVLGMQVFLDTYATEGLRPAMFVSINPRQRC